jgi:hypothetical protein
VWTHENRGRYDRSKLRYPSDLTDEEWALSRTPIPLRWLLPQPHHRRLKLLLLMRSSPLARIRAEHRLCR